MGHYGIVYIARNDQHPPNVYKIGGSSRDVDERMRELSNKTATYGTFEAKAFFPVTDWEAAEASCHNLLDEYRDDKEFFKAPYNELVDVVRNVCDGYQPEAHADEPTDGMSKALFLKQASPAHPDLRDADIDEENLARIEAMDELLRNAPKESPQTNWGLAQARAVVEILEGKQLEPELLKKGQAISLSLGLDDIKLAQENVPKISMVGWENLETALQAYIKNNPEHGVRNLDDLRVATLTAIYSIEGLENPVQ